ncbi:C39 family peptidase [Cohnella phaseoli]|uniref:Uncharacterized protein YvpB n=1 Tax=Cohnella phaseoli TaxID=456490 RepID=A0A3D9JPN5_9BACL|nr:C39 family peptidase [Cohnella phaseoli]RED76083.1 uncharacterized protein YvpB [Cohnella phaseoli]
MLRFLILFNALLIGLIVVFVFIIYNAEKKESIPKVNQPIQVGVPKSAPLAEVKTKKVEKEIKTDEPKKAVHQTEVLLSAPLVKQLPELRNGCEITSLAMLLRFYGEKVDKMDLVPELRRDPTPITYGKNRKILSWGDPNQGFVGDITGKTIGYGVYHGPLFKLLEKYIDSAVDLTGSSLESLEIQLSKGVPVIVWTTVNYVAPEQAWITWDSQNGSIQATFKEHSVLLTGYDQDHVYLNDPLSGKKQVKIEKSTFLSGWNALGNQAISYDPIP